MTLYRFEAKRLTGSARTIGPKLASGHEPYPLSQAEATSTIPEDSFFDIRTVVVSGDELFAESVAKAVK